MCPTNGAVFARSDDQVYFLPVFQWEWERIFVFVKFTTYSWYFVYLHDDTCKTLYEIEFLRSITKQEKGFRRSLTGYKTYSLLAFAVLVISRCQYAENLDLTGLIQTNIIRGLSIGLLVTMQTKSD